MLPNLFGRAALWTVLPLGEPVLTLVLERSRDVQRHNDRARDEFGVRRSGEVNERRGRMQVLATSDTALGQGGEGDAMVASLTRRFYLAALGVFLAVLMCPVPGYATCDPSTDPDKSDIANARAAVAANCPCTGAA